MNKIDSRFLNFSFIVKGTLNEPPETVANHDQYIVASKPTGAWEGATPSSIAHYESDIGKWKFIPPSYCHEVFDVSIDRLLKYSEVGWLEDVSDIRFVYNIKLLMFGYDTEPENPEGHGAIYFNTISNKVFRYDTDKWVEGANVQMLSGNKILVRYPNYEWKMFCLKDNGEYQEKFYATGLYIIEGGNFHADTNTITYLDEYSSYNYLMLYYLLDNFTLSKIYPSDFSTASTSGGKEFYTETHTLTASEVRDKSFTLSYDVESGEETNILCSVSGIIQPAGVAFEVSGDTLNWSGKTLDNASLAAGDVFVVHYVKASA